jgi:hypothetical protein
MPYLSRSLVGFHPASTEDADQLKDVELGDKVICFPADKLDDKARGIAQNRLYWKWLSSISQTQVEQYRGHTKEDWHERFKAKYLAVIFERDDQGYADTIGSLRELYKHDKQAAMDLRKGVIRLTSTAQASVKQFSEYLTAIDQFCASEGIQLPADRGLEEMALNYH